MGFSFCHALGTLRTKNYSHSRSSRDARRSFTGKPWLREFTFIFHRHNSSYICWFHHGLLRPKV